MSDSSSDSGSRQGPSVFIDDDAFIRAPGGLVYGALVDLSSYRGWWPGFRIDLAAPAGASWDAEATSEPHPLLGSPREPGAARLECRLRSGWRRLHLEVRPYGFRPGRGLFLDLSGDLDGVAEWWLEDGYGGTVVHHLARADTSRRRPAAVAEAYRRSVRRGLWGLKDALQSDVRRRAGITP